MRTARTSPTFRKILRFGFLLLCVILLVFASFLFLFFRHSLAREKELRTGEYELQIKALDRELEHCNYYLIDTLLHNARIQEMNAADRLVEKHAAARKLADELTADTQFWGEEYGFFFYDSASETPISKRGRNIPYLHHERLRNQLQENAGSVHYNDRTWQIQLVDETPYLYQVYGLNGNFMACWIGCDTFFSGLRSTVALQGSLFYLDAQGQPYPGSRQPESVKLFFELSTTLRMQRAALQVMIQEPLLLNGQDLPILLGFALTVLFIVTIAFLFLLFYYQRNIEKPLLSFQKYMDGFQLDQKHARTGVAEVSRAVAAFDLLTKEFERLRMESYEAKLAIAKTRLEYYQLQIKPHFFINCYSVLQAMAQKKEYNKIQALCIQLSHYVRYLLSDSLQMVPLRREMEMVRAYLDIQRIRHRESPEIFEQIDDEAGSRLIPPLLVLTFVENAAKHGKGGPDTLNVELDVCLEEDFLQIVVQDNGGGMKPDELNLLQKRLCGEAEWENGRQLGIHNIDMRLRILFGSRFTLKIGNENKGVKVCIRLPSCNETKEKYCGPKGEMHP